MTKEQKHEIEQNLIECIKRAVEPQSWERYSTDGVTSAINTVLKALEALKALNDYPAK